MKDLFYGLLLPSGNDAAMTIALSIGFIVHRKNLIDENFFQNDFIDVESIDDK